MVEHKKILFFGLGSIGKRHLKILRKLNNFDIYAYRTQKNLIPHINNIYDIDKVFNLKPDVAFITNPTHKHIETALQCLKSGIRSIFIEKPLSNSLDKLDDLIKEMNKMKAIIYVGYNMRYNPILIRLKQILEEINEKIIYSRTTCSSFLPEWRPSNDYRNIYSAKKVEGGGVILDLSHEFDYNMWLFGKINSIEGSYGKISNLEIETEDYCDVSLKFKNGLTAHIHLDYFSHFKERKINIITNTKEIIADLINNNILIKDATGLKEEKFNFEIDYIYEQQLKAFMDGIENKSINISNLIEAKNLLELLLKFKEEFF